MFAKQVNEQKVEGLRAHLLDVVQQQSQALNKVLYRFQQKEQHSDEDYIELNQAIVSIVDEVMASGDWTGSLYLRSIAKPFEQARAAALQTQQHLLGKSDAKEADVHVGETEQRLFVLLYQARGHELAQWQVQLSALADCLQGRPIYQSELDVQKSLRANDHLRSAKHAYVEVIVKRKHILTSVNARKDAHGSILLSLHEDALKQATMVTFKHLSKRYTIKDDFKLVLTNEGRPGWMAA